MLGRSDIVEGKPQAGELPDLALPPYHGPGFIHTAYGCQQSPVLDQHSQAGAGAAPASRASGVCARAGTSNGRESSTCGECAAARRWRATLSQAISDRPPGGCHLKRVKLRDPG